jgi:hypothetical protein
VTLAEALATWATDQQADAEVRRRQDEEDPLIDDPYAVTAPPQVRTSMANVHPARRLEAAINGRLAEMAAETEEN